ncbi:ribonuclease H-like domain-containing protein [Tanacetum coccineum]
MDLETTQTNAAAKLPLLKQGEYEIWRLKIEQYFQIQDYVLWNVIENGNFFKPTAQTIANADGTSTSMIRGPVTTEEKAQKKNDVKARSMLLMALPNEHQLTFNQYKDAKTLFAAIQTRFGGNDATKKTQRTLLKQSYENFNASNIESLDSIFDRLQKIVSQLAIVGENISQEDLNLKFLRKQIYEDDLEEMDLKCQLELLSMRARKYYQRTGKKITINGSDTTGYDKSKVECFNCHKRGHFARECRGLRNQESMPRNQDSSRRIVNVEDTSSKAMVAINEAGFDWSFMVEEEVTTNMSLMAFSDFEFNKSKFNLATYKRGLTSVEEKLVFYKKNEVMFCDQIAVLKRDDSFKDSEIIALKSETEKLKNEKECNQIKIDKFENASKCIDKLIRRQISDSSRKGVRCNAVPPLPTGLFAPPTIDLSNSGLEEFQQPEFKGYRPKAS